jgi:hypothetical protein
MLHTLSRFADSQPHATDATLTHGLFSKWLYICCTVPGICHLLEPLESTIRASLLPALTGKDPPIDSIQKLFALPARYGGLGIRFPNKLSSEFDNSYNISYPLISKILSQDKEYSYDTYCSQMNAKNSVRKSNLSLLEETTTLVYNSLSDDMQYAMDLAQEKGASIWLTTLPIKEHVFFLHKVTSAMHLP